MVFINFPFLMLDFSNLLNLYYMRNACFLFSVSLNYKKHWR